MPKKKEEPAKIEFKDKMKSGYYLEKETEKRLMEIYIKRMEDGQRVRKSNLIDEAVKVLFEKEFEK